MSTQANDPLPGNVASLTDLTEYQQGAIVSRTIIKRDHGSVTLFAFGDRQELSEHTTRFDAMVQGIDGAAEITIDGAGHRVSAGEAILLPANVPHALSAVTRFKMILTMINSDDG
ncbi:MAG: cupin domain-containing protein [SAR202 cluster bacterium]|nr:cupin domain-containing protein [SAR202 cluster bacterium]